MSNKKTSDGERINRRTLLTSLGAVAATGLAGCGSGGEGTGGTQVGTQASPEQGIEASDEELGERVPQLRMDFPSGSAAAELLHPVPAEMIEKHLGVKTELRPKERTVHDKNVITDKRVSALPNTGYPTSPQRLDPHTTLREFTVDGAGVTPVPNYSQYTDCEFTTLVHQQAVETDEEKRRDLVNEALKKMNEDIIFAGFGSTIFLDAYRTDEVEINSAGTQNLTPTNPKIYVNSQAKNDANTIIIGTGADNLQKKNYPTFTEFDEIGLWNHLIHSPLRDYDEDFNQINVLADTIEFENEGKAITAELKDGTFHNGDPITAEDVKFTYNQLMGHPGVYPQSPDPPMESIETIDEKTVQFNLSEVFAPFASKDLPVWGIMHKQTWIEGGAVENPATFDFEPPIGSGPFKVESFASSQSLTIAPHDDHPVYDANSSIIFQAFRNSQTQFQALKAGEIHLSPISVRFAQDAEKDENLEILARTSSMENMFIPFQMSYAPGKFWEFRRAVGLAQNLDKIIQLYSEKYGKPGEWGLPFTELHPWHPPTEDLRKVSHPDGPRPEKARQVLRDAGWGWDDDGNLHYPPDADLSPKWPKGERPDPADFECINEDYEYVPPEER